MAVSLKRQLLVLGLILAAAVLILYLGSLFIEVTLAAIAAGILYYLALPLVMLLERWRVPRTLAVLIVFIVFLGLVVLLFIYIVPVVVEQLTSLAGDVPVVLSRLEQWAGVLGSHLGAQIGQRQLDELVNRAASTVSGYIESAVTAILGTLADVFSLLLVVVAGVIAAFYLLKDRENIAGYLSMYVPEDARPRVGRLAAGADEVLSGFLRGQVIVALSVGALIGIAMLIIGVPYAFILGVIAAVLDIIPYLGPILATIPAVVIALTISPISAILVVVAILVAQQIESLVLSPRIVGSHVHLHPATIIFAVLVGKAILGVLGVFVAIPIAGIAKVVVEEYMLPMRQGEGDRGDGSGGSDGR